MLWSRSSRPSTSRRRLVLGVALLVVVAAGAVFALTRSGDDGAERRAVVASVRELVRTAAVTPERRGPALCARLTAGTRSRLEGLLELASSDQSRRGCDVAVAVAPWRLRPITVDRERLDASTWKVRIDGDEAVVDRGGGGQLHLSRVDGRWQADLEADAAWTHRLRIADACTRAGRSTAQLTPPKPTSASFRSYLRAHARILEILATRVDRERSPRGFARIDGRLVTVSRAAARRLRTAASRATSDPFRMLVVLERSVAGAGIELVGQLPVTVGRPFRRAVGPCFADTGPVSDPVGFGRFDRSCGRALQPLADLPAVTSLQTFNRFITVARAGFARIARTLRTPLLSGGQESVRRAVLSRLRRVDRAYAELRRQVASGRVPGPSLESELGLSVISAGIGLRQLGAACGEQTSESAPRGQLA